ncbi:AAA family ATPase [Longimicrobium sp.]|jgi:SpoVK/Ycf46/Vps4 family AAA+-type ATPase|uniref:AAA family ATPase n=1 Tax=Longimicrobium sp. TaxID=2029185 RepID=UPI002F9529AA
MSADQGRLHGLREAVRAAPEDPLLRTLLAEQLLAADALSEAEEHYRAALRMDPADERIQLGLARTFHAQGKRSAALVVIEDVMSTGRAPAEAHVLHARLLLSAGDREAAAQAYARARQADPRSADPALDEALGTMQPEPKPEVVDGRVRQPATTDWQPDDDEFDELDEAYGSPPGKIGVERPKVTFQDVGGMDGVKDEIRLKIIHPIQHAELYRAYGKTAGGGILMYGPPGCGKTFVARATAGEIGASFLSVGIHDVLDMWLGESERQLHELFEKARSTAPSVLFFDEVDAIAGSRADLRTSAGRQVVNQFLAELDGLTSANEGVLVLAATNAPWHLDSAFRRPGRFDRIIFVPPPDVAARAAILELLLRGKPTRDVDVVALAQRTDGLSGADLKDVVDRAVEGKLRGAIRSGIPEPLSTRDLLAAAKQVRPSSREWFDTARNYILYADKSGLYDPVRAYLGM